MTATNRTYCIENIINYRIADEFDGIDVYYHNGRATTVKQYQRYRLVGGLTVLFTCILCHRKITTGVCYAARDASKRTTCTKCRFAEVRMSEYFTDIHPLLTKVSKLEYITRKGYYGGIRQQSRLLSREMVRVWTNFLEIARENKLPLDIIRVINNIYVGIMCFVNRIARSYLILNPKRKKRNVPKERHF